MHDLKARSQVLRFVGVKYILWGQDICSHCMFKTIFFWAQLNLGGIAREYECLRAWMA